MSGKQSRNLGVLFELEIGTMLRACGAFLPKFPDRVCQPSQFDFIGALNSVPVGVECKATRRDVILVGDEKYRLHWEFSAAGGVAFLALGFRDPNSAGIAFLVPFRTVLDVMSSSIVRKSINRITRDWAEKNLEHFALHRLTGGWKLSSDHACSAFFSEGERRCQNNQIWP
uniref:Putative recombination protein U n=1 Tax=viral metagenome TaxID=1070528 RepID=A0A6M3KVI2_9ZZZZ